MTTAATGWAGTTDDMFDLHQFGPERTAQCNPAIRTHSRSTPDDATREPYATLRTRAQIEATGLADMYTFCPTCTTTES